MSGAGRAIVVRHFVAGLVVALLAGALVVGDPVGPDPVRSSDDVLSVRLVPEDGGAVFFDGKRYEGPIDITSYIGGLGVVEVVSIDAYLMGIREVPFAWPEESLKTQVVAARTYVAWTLRAQPSETATKYGYDICATSVCQVYKGTTDLDSAAGDRWRAAVESTSGELLLYEGVPAQALYSSSMGSETLANQDVWGGRAIPYLQPVSSPEVGIAPFATWTVVVPTSAFVEVLRRDGVEVGRRLDDVTVVRTDQGVDRAMLIVQTEEGVTRIPATRLRGALNRWGPRLYPSSYPVVTPKGNTYPQTMLSYSYDVELQGPPQPVTPVGVQIADVPTTGSVVIRGEGFGHGVGLSQWGAKIMADGGARYDEILSHYYGGLVPSPAEDQVPDFVRVGLVAGRPSAEIEVVGPVSIEVNGVRAGFISEGVWVFHADGPDVLRLRRAVGYDGLLERVWPR